MSRHRSGNFSEHKILTLELLLKVRQKFTIAEHGLNGWMDDLRFYVLFNSISVLSGRCLEEKSVCNATPFKIEKISPRKRIELGPLDQ